MSCLCCCWRSETEGGTANRAEEAELSAHPPATEIENPRGSLQPDDTHWLPEQDAHVAIVDPPGIGDPAGRSPAANVSGRAPLATADDMPEAGGDNQSKSIGIVYAPQGLFSNHPSAVEYNQELDSGAEINYVQYAEEETEENVNNLVLMGLCRQRSALLKESGKLVKSTVENINQLREQHGSGSLSQTEELNEVACELWVMRAKIEDGFVVVPRCMFYPRLHRRGSHRPYGCLTYYTTRAEHPATVPRAATNFWYRNGAPSCDTQTVCVSELPGTFSGQSLHSVADFPSAELADCYVKTHTRMGHQFKRYRGTFQRQLVSPECTKVGLHVDMVRTPEHRNLVCIVVVFDFVANNEKDRAAKD